MKITIDIPEYSDDTGLLSDNEGGTIQIIGDPEGKHAWINADRDGMLTLAYACLSMAYNWDSSHPGDHLHIDEHPLLEKGSTALVVCKLNQ